MTIKEIIANNLQKYRKEKNITQKQLAEKLGIKHSAISSWENGINSIDIDVLFEICTILDITINDIVGKEQNPPNDLTIAAEPHQTAIKKYLALNPEHQANIRGMIDLYAAQEQLSATVRMGGEAG